MASIRKRNDKWQVRIRIKGFTTIEKAFLTRADAEAWGKITESEMIRGTYIRRTEAEQTTLYEALGRYEREVTPTKRGAVTEQFRVKAWKAHRLAKKSMGSLRSADFAQYRDERLETAAPATVRRELDVVRHLFNVARREWGFEGLANPIEAIRLPTVRNARERVLFPGEEAWLMVALADHAAPGTKKYRQGARNPWIKPIVQLALQTAMRRGELLSLTWGNIDLKRQTAHLPITKNGHSRDVPLTLEAVKILEALPRTLRGPVFPVSANALKLGFVRAINRARDSFLEDCATRGVDADNRMLVDLHFHDLRHEATSQLAGKLQAHELAKVTGHLDLRLVMRYYHPKAEELARKLG